MGITEKFMKRGHFLVRYRFPAEHYEHVCSGVARLCPVDRGSGSCRTVDGLGRPLPQLTASKYQLHSGGSPRGSSVALVRAV